MEKTETKAPSKKLYLCRAVRELRQQYGGAWAHTENGIGFWCSLDWHEIELTETHAALIEKQQLIEIHECKPPEMYPEHPTEQEGWEGAKVISDESTSWSVAPGKVRERTLDDMFATDDTIEEADGDDGLTSRAFGVTDNQPAVEVPTLEVADTDIPQDDGKFFGDGEEEVSSDAVDALMSEPVEEPAKKTTSKSKSTGRKKKTT